MSKLDEPFAGLFTQGMVCHETYKDKDGNWLSPDEVEKRDGKAYLKGTDVEVTVGSSEKMSKSKKNVVAPKSIIDIFGADTIRWFMLSDTPPERDIEWTESGAEGCWRFVQRIWRLVSEAEDLPPPGTPIGSHRWRGAGAAPGHPPRHRGGHRRSRNSALQSRGGADLYSRQCDQGGGSAVSGAVRREALEALVLLIGPMMPHLAESCWEALGHKTMIVETPWPSFIEALTRSETVTIAVQVNGKRRDEVTVAINAAASPTSSSDRPQKGQTADFHGCAGVVQPPIIAAPRRRRKGVEWQN